MLCQTYTAATNWGGSTACCLNTNFVQQLTTNFKYDETNTTQLTLSMLQQLLTTLKANTGNKTVRYFGGLFKNWW